MKLGLAYVKDKKGLAPMALFGFAAVLAVLIVVKVSGFVATATRAEDAVKKAVVEKAADGNDVGKHLAKSKETADELKKRNLFAPPPPRENPVKDVSGIFGIEALINSEWRKAGDKVADAKVVAIEPTQVKVEWEGNTSIFAPINSGGGPGGGEGERGRGRMRERDGANRPPGGPPGMATFQAGSMAMGGPGGMGPFGMSPEERAQMRERFMNMSEEERQAFRDQMRERFGGRGGGEGRSGERRGGDRSSDSGGDRSEGGRRGSRGR